MSRKPRVFDIEAPATARQAETPAPPPRDFTIEEAPDPFPLDKIADEPPPTPRKRRGFGLLSFAFSAFVGFLVLVGTNAAWRAIAELVAWSPVLGWAAAGLLAAALLAALLWIGRETRALLRLARIEKLRERAEDAHARRDDAVARAFARDLVALYRDRPDAARGRARLEEIEGELVDARDRLAIAESQLLRPFDERARAIIAESAKRVSVVTALSPRALVDILFVAAESLRLVRRLAELYGARPGFFGAWRLVRAVLGHLALTGGVAMGDELLHQLVGQGLAARLSARLGEGMLNGLLTARVGLAALDSCRPMPFRAEKAPSVRDVAGALWSRE